MTALMHRPGHRPPSSDGQATRVGAARVAQDPEEHRLALAHVAPARDRACLCDERLACAQGGATLPELDLHEAASDGHGLDTLVTHVGLARGTRRQAREEHAQADAEVVQEGQQARGAALAGIVAAGQLVAALRVAAQQLVERDVEVRREVEQRVEREA